MRLMMRLMKKLREDIYEKEEIRYEKDVKKNDSNAFSI
jgi:hypothetical protein